MTFSIARFSVAASFVCFSAVPVWAQKLEAVPANQTGVYRAGEAIAWDIKTTGDEAGKIASVTYQIKRSGGKVLEEGTLPMTGGAAHLTTKQTEPMAYLVEFRAVGAVGANGKEITALAGALLEPQKIAPVQTRPADFDAFWAKKLAELRAIPANPQVTEEPSGRDNVRYFKLTLQNISGATVYAQMAYPTTGSGKYPALMLLQYAGVYGLKKEAVTNRAADGWLAINVMPHSLPLDRSPEFYTEAANTTLKSYATQGNDNRETSYMLRIILGDVRASDYVTSRGDWDGKTLVTEGTSQGGYQSFALAGLQPKISALSVNVPAGCDLVSRTEGRGQGWPYWLGFGPPPTNEAATIETSRYFDPANFAPRIKAPCLVSMGLIDVTSPPANVYGTVNRLKSRQKEVIVLPLSNHHGDGNTQAKYWQRSSEWLRALQSSGKIPPPPSAAVK